MEEMFEIRWHGRGGQGAKTAALLFGDAAVSTGKYIQAFPEYGPERMGAPVASFNRISSKSIRIHSGITNPDVVIVLDVSLIEQVNVLEGLEPEKGTESHKRVRVKIKVVIKREVDFKISIMPKAILMRIPAENATKIL